MNFRVPLCSAPSPYFDSHNREGIHHDVAPAPESVAIGPHRLRRKLIKSLSLSRALIQAQRLPRPWLNRSIESVITKLHDIQWTTKRSSGRFNPLNERGSQANKKKGRKRRKCGYFFFFLSIKRRSIRHVVDVESSECAKDTRPILKR